MEGTSSILGLALLAAVAVWLGLAVATVAGRLLYERRRNLAEEAADAPQLAHGSRRMVRRALRHRTQSGKWRRIIALRALVTSGHPRGRALLRRALADHDRDVVAAAIKALGDLGTPWAGEQLIGALRHDRYQRSRIAAQLERFTPSLADSLVPLLHDGEPAVRFWGATLLGRCPGHALEPLIALTHDADANVRCAAIEALSARREVAALRPVRERMYDERWFVRVHACRAVGELGTIDEAPRLARSLRDPWWWVRSAAKGALRGFGPTVAGAVIPYLDDDDDFARNGAAEVLQDVGFIDSLATTGSDGRLLQRIFAAGGSGMRDAARLRAESEVHDPVPARAAAGDASA